MKITIQDVINALDSAENALKMQLWHKLFLRGTTAQRPTLGVNDAGTPYWDTTLGTILWWDGSQWK